MRRAAAVAASVASRPSVASDLVERGHEPEMTRAIARALVCTENLILIDYVTESPNVNGDDRAALLLPDPVIGSSDGCSSGQKRGVFGRIKRELRRRSAIEAVIGHMKAEGHLGRCYLKGRAGDAANVILSAVGYNLRLVLAWLRTILRVVLLALFQTFARTRF